VRRAAAVLLVLAFAVPLLPRASAVAPDAVTVVFERTFDVAQYVNGSTVEAWAGLNFPGNPDPPAQVDNIEFRWYDPRGALGASFLVDPDANGWALGTHRAMRLGSWSVNATYLGTPTFWDNRTFEVVPEAWSGTIVLARSTMVGQNATLTIAPGTTVRSDPGVYLRVKGTLTADGTPALPIFLTTNGSASPGAWEDLLFHPEAGNRSFLEQVRLQYGTDGIQIDGAAPRLENVSVADSLRNGFLIDATTLQMFGVGASRTPTGFRIQSSDVTIENGAARDVSYGILQFGGSVAVHGGSITNATSFGITANAPTDLENVTFGGGGVGITTSAPLRGERLTFSGLSDAIVASAGAVAVIGNSTFTGTSLRDVKVGSQGRVDVISGTFPAGERVTVDPGGALFLYNYVSVRVVDHDAGDANLSGAQVDIFADGAPLFRDTTAVDGTIPTHLVSYRQYAPTLREIQTRIRVSLAGYAFELNDRDVDTSRNSVHVFRGSTADLDGDGDPDFSDADVDGDDLDNAAESALGTDPRDPDTDGDGLPDGWEFDNQPATDPLDPTDPDLDYDDDGLTNRQEYGNGTNARERDSDDDGMDDGFEVAHGFDPTNATDADGDADGDGFSNLEEYNAGTNPHNADDYPRGDWLAGTWPFLVALVAAILIIALSLVIGRRRKTQRVEEEKAPDEKE